MVLAVSPLAACDIVGVRGSGDVITESREVSDFTEIELRGSGTVTVAVDGTASLTIAAEDNLMPLLISDVEDGRLVLGSREPISPTQGIVYNVTVSELEVVFVGGSGELNASGIDSPAFEISVSGSGSVLLTDLDTEELVVDMSGSGEVEVTGTAGHLDLSISGSADYLGEGLTAATAVVEVSGSGDAVVNVTEHLEADVSGSGHIEYLGDPSVDSSTSGAGEVEPR